MNFIQDLKILVLGPIPPPMGGDSVWFSSFMNCLSTLDISFRFIDTSVIGGRFAAHNIGRSYIYEIARCLKIWLKSILFLISYKPSIVHLNTNCSPLGLLRDILTVVIFWLARIPVVLHCHTNIPYALNRSILGRFALITCIKLSSSVIVLNRNSLRYCQTVSRSKPVIIPNFIFPDSVLRNKVISNKIVSALFVGHIVETKGIFELLKAAEFHQDITFICAGTILIDTNCLVVPNNVSFVGNLDHKNLLKLYRSADVFVFPTYSEGFSISLLEAMSAGLPVITTKVGANCEMLGDQGGIFVKPKSSIDLVSALRHLEAPNLRASMSSHNLQKVGSNYTDTIVIPKLLSLYEKLILSAS